MRQRRQHALLKLSSNDSVVADQEELSLRKTMMPRKGKSPFGNVLGGLRAWTEAISHYESEFGTEAERMAECTSKNPRRNERGKGENVLCEKNPERAKLFPERGYKGSARVLKSSREVENVGKEKEEKERGLSGDLEKCEIASQVSPNSPPPHRSSSEANHFTATIST